MRNHKTAVVVVTYNNAFQLENLLADLARQTLMPDEIIIIDNASIDDTREVVERSPIDVRYVRNNINIGSAGGFREGIRLACESGDLIWLLDDDVSVEPDALEKLVEGILVISMREKVGAVRSWNQISCSFSEATKVKRGFAWRGTLIKKEAVETIGLPRREYFLYSDDVEYSFRMLRSGYSIYWIPASRVIEKPADAKINLNFLGHRLSIHKDAFRIYYASRNQINLFLEYRNIPEVIKTLFYAVKLMVIFAIFSRKEFPAASRAIVSGIWDGIRGNLGVNDKYLPPGYDMIYKVGGYGSGALHVDQ